MADIVERLRRSVTKCHEPTDEDAVEAADEIERLRASCAPAALAEAEEEITTTIERCAQVAEQHPFDPHTARQIAAAIRALKDKP